MKYLPTKYLLTSQWIFTDTYSYPITKYSLINCTVEKPDRQHFNQMKKVSLTSNRLNQHHISADNMHWEEHVVISQDTLESNYDKTWDKSKWGTFFKVTDLDTSETSRSRKIKTSLFQIGDNWRDMLTTCSVRFWKYKHWDNQGNLSRDL